MISIWRALGVGVGLSALLAVVLVVSLSALNPDLQSTAPTDETLEANFAEHKKDLESLVEMARADKSVTRIANDFTWLETDASWPRPEGKLGFSEDRWSQYRALFREVGLRGGILRENVAGTTYLISWTRGLMTNGLMKGYVYSENDLAPLVQSLDDEESWPKNKRILFKKLEGNWYLFLMG